MNAETLNISLASYGTVITCNQNGNNTNSFIIKMSDVLDTNYIAVLNTINVENNGEYPYIYSSSYDNGLISIELNKIKL